MSIFAVAGVEYPVSPSITVRGLRLDHQRQAFSGRMRSALHHDTNTVARSWDLTVGLLTDIQATTLMGVLTAPGTVAIAGSLTGARTCKAVDVTREDGIIADAVTIRVVLEEVLS